MVYTIKVWDAIHGKPPTKDGITIFPTLLHPRSKGTIRLRSANPNDMPLINPNYLAEDSDAKILVEGECLYDCLSCLKVKTLYRVALDLTRAQISFLKRVE